MLLQKSFLSMFLVLSTALTPFTAAFSQVNITSDVEVPPQAIKVTGVSKPVIDMSTTAGNKWKFLFESPAGIPFPDAVNQDFDFTAWQNNKKWDDVIVPGGLLMQGFDIKNNNEYYYQTKITIPSDFAGNRILVRFDAVYTNTRVWIEGKYVRTHKGGFTTWDCDITDFVTSGQTVTMTVGVTDIDGKTTGIWNPTGATLADLSGASFYANHNIGGITRDVNLMALPKNYIALIHTDTEFTDRSFTDANLNIKAQLGMVSASASLLFEIVDKAGKTIASGTLDFVKEKNGLSNMKNTSIFVKTPLKWDAEHPNLYTLKSTLTVNADVKQVYEQKFGFRQINFGGTFGDKNKVYINGQEIKLRGVCRHDVSWNLGRSTIKELDYQEIRDYKAANINFIRTSHYPVSRHLLDACDEMGIYVEEENAACWVPGGTNAVPAHYLNGFKEFVERDRNRTCILIWSIANESGWNNGFAQMYDYIRKTDASRLVVFSFPGNIPDSANVKLDLYSVHYDEWNSTKLGKSDIAVLHDEYAPPPVHHYYEIQRDLNARNFWGETIYKFWNNIFETDGCLGGAVWCADDEVFFIPEGTTKRIGTQGDYDGYTTGSGNWGNVHDTYKRLKPEAWLTKKGYSPIRLDSRDASRNVSTLMIPVKNMFDHTNFNELIVEYSIDKGAVETYTPPSIPPHGQGILTFDIAHSQAKQVNLKFYTTFNGVKSLVDEFNIYLEKPQYAFIPESAKAPTVKENKNIISVAGKDFSIIFDKSTGLIKEAKHKNSVLITGGPYFYTTDDDFGKWIPAKTDGITVKKLGKQAIVTLKGNYEEGQGVEFAIKISGNGIITTDYTLTTQPSRADKLQEVGICYDIPSDIKSVSWLKDTYHSAYPEGHIGRPEGTALKVRPDFGKKPDTYGKFIPDWGWEMDMNDFALYVKDDPNDGIVTNDFKSMRENIWTYDVNFNGTNSRISVESEGKHAARIDVKYDWDLVDCMNERIKYTGSWTPRYNERSAGPGWASGTFNHSYNKSEMLSASDGASCEFSFTGTGVSFISAREQNLGLANIYIDGQFKKQVRLNANWGTSKKRVLYSIAGLDYGQHTIKIEQIGGAVAVKGFEIIEASNPIIIDAFGVLNKKNTDPAAQVSRLIINEQWYYPNFQWGSYPGVPGKISEGSKGSATIRLTGDITR